MINSVPAEGLVSRGQFRQKNTSSGWTLSLQKGGKSCGDLTKLTTLHRLLSNFQAGEPDLPGQPPAQKQGEQHSRPGATEDPAQPCAEDRPPPSVAGGELGLAGARE